MTRPSKSLFYTSPSKSIMVVSYVDGDGDLVVETYEDDDCSAEDRIEELQELDAKFHVVEIGIN